MRLPSALVLVPALLVAPALRAQEREPQLNLAREAPQASRWYGWQLIASDLAAISLISAAAKIGDGPAPVVLGSLGVATFLLVPPLLHLAHGSAHDAGVSFAIRTAPALLGLAAGVLVARNQDCAEGCSALVLPIVGLAGSAVGMVVDWAALSTEPAPQISVAPVPGPGARGAGLGLAFRF